MEVVTLSSDVESEGEGSDVETITRCSNVLSRTDPLPHQASPPDGATVNAPMEYIGLTGSRWILPDLKILSKCPIASIPIIDLTDDNAEIKEAAFEMQNVCSPTDEQDNTVERSTSADLFRLPRDKICELKRTRSRTDPPTLIHTQTDEAHSPFVKLTRLPFIENHITELKQLSCFVYSIKGRTCMSLQPGEEDLSDSFFSLEHRDNAADTPTHSNSSYQTSVISACECTLSGRHSRGQLEDNPAEDMIDVTLNGTTVEDLELEDPVCFYQQAWDFEEEGNDEFPVDLLSDAGEDKAFVCPVALKKLLSGQDEELLMDVSFNGEAFGPPEELCYQTLRLVYSTIEENHTEGTLQLLSDLLQPGYYLPKDITFHLLRDILLGPDSPYHLCLQAFHLLIRTQRHQPADIKTAPWDWDLLTSVMSDKEHPNKQKCKVVRMLLEYVVRTLEDDFHNKRAISALHHSISRATLSCDRQFHHVRDLLKWLFSSIVMSTEHGESQETARERGEHIRLVSIFQRILSFALEADCCPTLQSAKLSQELFHMLISGSFGRVHRILLLESLRSNLLRCKLLGHMLDYACSVKSPLPVSLSFLLHFMKNCVLLQDPTDGPERWRSWEELVTLLCMFLHSYNKTMKGYVSQSFMEERSHLGPFKKEDVISQSQVCEAIDTLLARAQADLGQALPHRVEESLHFLRDSLYDVCQV